MCRPLRQGDAWACEEGGVLTHVRARFAVALGVCHSFEPVQIISFDSDNVFVIRQRERAEHGYVHVRLHAEAASPVVGYDARALPRLDEIPGW